MERDIDIEYAVSLYRNGVINFDTLLQNMRAREKHSLAEEHRKLEEERISKFNECKN